MRLLRTSVSIALLLLGMATAFKTAAASYLYSYSGPNFEYINNTLHGSGMYTEAMRVEGFVELSEPLLPNWAYVFGVPVLNYQWADGVNVFTPANSQLYTLFLTDFAGAIREWDIELRATAPRDVSRIYSRLNSNGGLDAGTFCNSSVCENGFVQSVGQWTVSTIPEADQYAMLFAGIGILGFNAWRRRSKQGRLPGVQILPS